MLDANVFHDPWCEIERPWTEDLEMFDIIDEDFVPRASKTRIFHSKFDHFFVRLEDDIGWGYGEAILVLFHEFYLNIIYLN